MASDRQTPQRAPSSPSSSWSASVDQEAGVAHPSCVMVSPRTRQVEMISILELAVDEGEQLILINPVESWDVGKVDVIQV